MQDEKTYTQKYNETHYRQINMRVSEEVAVKFDALKNNFGSAPKLLLAGLLALENQNNFEIEVEKLRKENQKLNEDRERLLKEGQEIIDKKSQRIKELKQQIDDLKSRNFFDYLFSGLQSGGNEK